MAPESVGPGGCFIEGGLGTQHFDAPGAAVAESAATIAPPPSGTDGTTSFTADDGTGGGDGSGAGNAVGDDGPTREAYDGTLSDEDEIAAIVRAMRAPGRSPSDQADIWHGFGSRDVPL